MQHYSCDFTPVGTSRVRVEHAQIGDECSSSYTVNTASEGAASATSGSSGGFCMGGLAKGVDPPLCFGPLAT
jgi:hypothetical protein